MAALAVPIGRSRQGLHPPRAMGGDESGAAILEFALVLPILVILLGGAFELGRALLIREEMINAVRDGASYLARVPDPNCDDTCSPGASRAVARARDQIIESTGVLRPMVAVSSRVDSAAQTVTITANVRVAIDLLRLAGFRPIMTLDVAQTERRLAD